MKSPKGLNHPRRYLINIQNINNNHCFECCLVRYLHPADYNPRIITKADKYFARKLNFKDVKFLGKIGEIHNIIKKILSASAFFVMKRKKISKLCVKKYYQKVR